MVESVTTHHHRVSQKPTIHIYTLAIVEIEGRILDGERNGTVNRNTTINNHRSATLNDAVGTHHQVVQLEGIPREGMQIDHLLYPTLQLKDNLVVNSLRLQLTILGRREFHKHTNTVVLSYLQISNHGTVSIVQIDAVHIDPVSRLVALFQTHTPQTQAVRGVVINPEVIGLGPYIRENGIHLHRIRGKRQKRIGTRGKRVVI